VTVFGGDITFASDLNNLDLATRPLVVRKAADLSRASTTVAVNDPDLKVTLPAARYYLLIGHVVYNAATAGDLKGGLYSPGSGSYAGSYEGQPATAASGSGAVTTDQVGVGTGYVWGGAGATDLWAQFIGIAYSGVGGDFGFTWAQGTSSATATIVRANSFLAFFPCAF